MRIEIGKEYEMAGYKWTAIESTTNDGLVLLQSHGVCTGVWPGVILKQEGPVDIGAINIANCYPETKDLFEKLGDAILVGEHGYQGLFLIPARKAYHSNGDRNARNALSIASARFCMSCWLSESLMPEWASVIQSDTEWSALSSKKTGVIAPAVYLKTSMVTVTDDNRIILNQQLAKKAFKFENSADMLRCLYQGFDYYNIETGTYVFTYNDMGSIAYYTLSKEEAYEVSKKAKKAGETCWSSCLGGGGWILDGDSALSFVMDAAKKDSWISCDDFANNYINA